MFQGKGGRVTLGEMRNSCVSRTIGTPTMLSMFCTRSGCELSTRYFQRCFYAFLLNVHHITHLFSVFVPFAHRSGGKFAFFLERKNKKSTMEPTTFKVGTPRGIIVCFFLFNVFVP